MAVAYSGGRDSTALLHATLGAAGALGTRVVALHVHHGLSKNADAWLAHCAAQCERWASRGHDLVFASTRLTSRPRRGDSVEAWARQARYHALREMALAAGADLVLLGHHRRDQAETFLLQALRSGGVAALSAMPALVRRDGVTWARPWLDVPAAKIEAYARRHRLRWIDDDSNDDTRYARNRLRLDVWPALLGAFPDAESTLAAAAGKAQQAAAIVDERAALDVADVADVAGGPDGPDGPDGEHLSIARWRALSQARRAQALRVWLRRRVGAAAPASLIDRLEAELDVASTSRWPAGEGELRSYRGRLRWHAAPIASLPAAMADTFDFSRPGSHDLPVWRGSLRIHRVGEGGIAASLAKRLTLRARAPGDRFQAGPGRPPRSLKLQFQAAALPAAARHGPVACDHRGGIVFVAGLGIDARALAQAGEPQLGVTWVPWPEATEADRGAR